MILQFGNAFFNSAKPASVIWVFNKISVLSCCNLAASLRPSSVIWVRVKQSLSSFCNLASSLRPASVTWVPVKSSSELL